MTISELLPPPRALSSCIFSAIYRDTRGAGLRREDRFNYFPASPMVTVTVVRSGGLALVPASAGSVVLEDLPPLPRISVTAPNDHPIASWSPGEVEAVSIGFFPDAWLRLGGTADFATPPASVSTAISVLDGPAPPAEAWPAFCDALAPEWTARRDASWSPAADLTDWARSLMFRAALSGRGESIRSFERYLKRLSGHSKRTLDFYAAIETLSKIVAQQPDAPPSAIADMAGYADQSHMGRSVRRATGFSPVALNAAIATQEPFWCYRLLRRRF